MRAEAHDRLNRAGWAVGSAGFATAAGGRAWVVPGHNGGNLIRAGGATQAEAWRGALDRARALDIPGVVAVLDPPAVEKPTRSPRSVGSQPEHLRVDVEPFRD
jgi:hypothetical protein